MTLKEAFDLLMPGHRPKMEMSESGIWWCLVGSDFVICPEALAESAICWAMVKALAKRQVFASVFSPSDDNPEWMAETEIEERHGKTPLASLAAAYAAAFPKEKA